MDQAAEAIPAPNARSSRNRLRPSPDLVTPERAKREASVGPLIVVVPHVLVEDPLEMAPTPDQQPVQTLGPDRPDPALGDRVGIWRLDRGLEDLGAVGDEDVVEGAGELAVAVTKEEPRHAGAVQRFHRY